MHVECFYEAKIMSKQTAEQEAYFKHYRKRLQRIIRELGVATLDKIVERIMSERPDANEGTILKYCNACCVNGTNRHNLFPKEFNPDNHFLIRLDSKLYARFNRKYFDRIGIYQKESPS